MGAARQRKATQKDRYGYPEIFILQIFSGDAAKTVRVPLPIKRKPKPLMTQQDALALAGLIFAYYTKPTEGIWVAVETAVGAYCRPSDVKPSLETIKPIAQQLPKAFWGWVKATTFDEKGDRVMGEILEIRDPLTGHKQKRIFESVQGAGPEQPKPQPRSVGTFEQQLLEVSR
jgi:hypothetical protein